MQAYPGKLKEAIDQVEAILRRQRNVKYNEANNFDISTAEKTIHQFDSITAAIGLIAIAISGVGLLVWRDRRHEYHARQRDGKNP